MVENLSCFMCVAPAETEPGENLPSHTVNMCPLCDLFSEILFTFLCCLLVISLFEMAPKHSAEMLSLVSKSKKLQCTLWKKMCELAKLPSLLSYSAIGHKFNVNGPTICFKRNT